MGGWKQVDSGHNHKRHHLDGRCRLLWVVGFSITLGPVAPRWAQCSRFFDYIRPTRPTLAQCSRFFDYIRPTRPTLAQCGRFFDYILLHTSPLAQCSRFFAHIRPTCLRGNAAYNTKQPFPVRRRWKGCFAVMILFCSMVYRCCLDAAKCPVARRNVCPSRGCAGQRSDSQGAVDDSNSFRTG